MESESIGQAEAEPVGTTAEAPTAEVTTDQTSDKAPESDFFDYNEIKGKPELEAAYKQMQSAWTKKMQSLSDEYKSHAEKVQAYDQFMENPQENLKALMQQYGLQQPTQEQNGFDPQSWEDVISHVKGQIFDELKPVFQEVQSFKKQNIEQYMDNNFPDWRMYETDMMQNLQKHPSLSSDPGLLYRMSVPENVLNSRATQEALKKLKEQSQNAHVSGGSQTTRKATAPTRASSFKEAFEMAKQQLQERR